MTRMIETTNAHPSPYTSACGTRFASRGDGMAWVALLLLTLVYAFSIADRFVCSTLTEAIKAEFVLSDGMTGLATGSALALLFAEAGLPLGALADRGNRKVMITVSLAIWSAFTAMTGITSGLVQFVVTRMGVGIAEAGAGPAVQSIIADTFRPSQRSAAIAVLASGAALGGALGSAGGGILGALLGWRAAMIAFGAMGGPLVLLLALVLKEPRRGRFDGDLTMSGASVSAASPTIPPPSYRAFLRLAMESPALQHLLAGATLVTFCGWGMLWWTPAFLARSMGIDAAGSGALLGPIHLAGGIGVSLGAALILRKLGHRDLHLQARFLTISTIVFTVAALVAFTTASRTVATAMLWLFIPLIYAYIGPVGGLGQTLVPPAMRARFAAILLFVTNIANLVLAPWIIGSLSDGFALLLAAPQQSLRFALAVSALSGLWGAWHFHRLEQVLRCNSTPNPRQPGIHPIRASI